MLVRGDADDEELLMIGVSVSEESQKVLNGGVTASKKSNMLNSGVSTS
jgi:hypothetical protein